LIAWRSEAREKFDVKDGRIAAAAEGGARSARILDIEFLSRKMVARQSMSDWRCDQRPVSYGTGSYSYLIAISSRA
jgi:hypothetical protein